MMAVSTSDLIAQMQALDRQISAARSSTRAQAIAEIRRLMTTHGLGVTDLNLPSTIVSSPRVGKKVAPKYRDPISGATWSGRGLHPKWMVAAIDDGKSVGDFKIHPHLDVR